MYWMVDGKWEKCVIKLDDFRLVGVGDVLGELLVYVEVEEGKLKGLYCYDMIVGK